LARLVPAHHSGDAGPRGAGHPARKGRKKLQTGRCRSAYPNCATYSLTFSGADGTALSIFSTGPNGEGIINSTPCAVTIGNEARRCRSSIYNCSTRDMLNPCARSSRPMSAPYSNAASVSQLADAATLAGKAVEYRPFTPLERTPYAASLISIPGIPSRSIPATYPTPRFDSAFNGVTGSSCGIPFPCSNWIFSSIVICFSTRSARSSGERFSFIHGRSTLGATPGCENPGKGSKRRLKNTNSGILNKPQRILSFMVSLPESSLHRSI